MNLTELRRRSYLGAVTTALANLAGCSGGVFGRSDSPSESQGTNSNNPSTIQQTRATQSGNDANLEAVPQHDHSGSNEGGTSLAPDEVTTSNLTADSVTAGILEVDLFGLSPTFLIGKTDGNIFSLNGKTLNPDFVGRAGEDDAKVIQKTFDAMPETGGSIFIKNETYEIGQYDSWGTGLKLHTDNTQVISNGAHLRFHEHSPEKDIKFDFAVNAESVRIQGLHIDGNKENRSHPTRTLELQRAQDVTVRDCLIRGGRREKLESGAGYGINPYETSGLLVDNCIIRDNDRHGIHPGGDERDLKDIKITNSSFFNNATNPTGAAIDVRGRTKEIIISQNYFSNNGKAIRLKGDNKGTVHIANNIFRDNYHPNGKNGQITITDNYINHSIIGNQFLLNLGPTEPKAVHIQTIPGGQARNLIIENNYVRGGDQFINNSDAAGIHDFLVINQNTVQNLRDNGIELSGANTAIIKGNTFWNITQNTLVVRGDTVGGVIMHNVIPSTSFPENLHNFETKGNVTL